MKKLIIPLLVIVPVIIYLKLRNSSSGLNGREKVLEKKPLKAKMKTNNLKKNETKSPVKKPAAVKNARCKASTANGKKCARESLPDSDYCWQHSEN